MCLVTAQAERHTYVPRTEAGCRVFIPAGLVSLSSEEGVDMFWLMQKENRFAAESQSHSSLTVMQHVGLSYCGKKYSQFLWVYVCKLLHKNYTIIKIYN